MQQSVVRGRNAARELACLILAAAACESVYLGCAAAGLRIQDLPLDYERWGGYLFMAIIVVPQAFGVGYFAWVLGIRRFVPGRYAKHLGVSILLGVALGCLYYLLGANLKWIVPWMVLLTKG